MLSDDEVERVLVVTAHPDDVDFGAAGTVATWTAAGIEVSYCVVTDGDAGGFDPEVPRSEIAGIRRQEQRVGAPAFLVGDDLDGGLARAGGKQALEISTARERQIAGQDQHPLAAATDLPEPGLDRGVDPFIACQEADPRAQAR